MEIFVLVSDSWHKGAFPSFKIPVVGEERIRPSHHFGFMLRVFFSAWTDGRKSFRPVNNLRHLFPTVLCGNKWKMIIDIMQCRL